MLLYTHALVWALIRPDKQLSKTAHDAISSANTLEISAASLYEISYKALIGKWPEVSDFVVIDVSATLLDAGIEIIAADGDIMHSAGSLDWQHRDPFDRIIVATALDRDLPLISADKTLDSVPVEGLDRIW